MALKIEYGEDIIVGVSFRGEWGWYVSEKDFWLMDQVGYGEAFTDAGHVLPPAGVDRFDIPILNEETAGRFLELMESTRVDKAALSEEILSRLPASSWDELIELCPSLLIDFERKVLKSLYPEPMPFEEYVPAGWTGEYENFLDEIPEEHRYWVIDGRDYFEPFFSGG